MEKLQEKPPLPIRKVSVFGKSYLFPLDTAFQGRIETTRYDGSLARDPREPIVYGILTFYHANFPNQNIRIQKNIRELVRKKTPKAWEDLWIPGYQSFSFWHPPQHDREKIEKIEDWFERRFTKFIPSLENQLDEMFLAGSFEVEVLAETIPDSFN